MRHASAARIFEVGAAIVGAPDTVAEQLIASARDFNVGNLVTMLKMGSMPRDLVEENVARFVEGVLPRLRAETLGEDWPHHWWPERLGGSPQPAGVRLDALAGAA